MDEKIKFTSTCWAGYGCKRMLVMTKSNAKEVRILHQKHKTSTG
jgi:hypothetical protein